MFKSCSLVINSRKLLKSNSKCFIISPICNFSLSFQQHNHYDTLQLSKSCTKKDIKDAFISLSKKYHPDKNKNNPKAQEQFVKINEAYNVLIKTESRKQYDLNLQHFGDPYKVYPSPNKNDFYEVHRYDSHYRDPWKDPSFARNRKTGRDTNNDDNYYGVNGMKKMAHNTLVFWMITLAGVGLFVQILILRFAGIRSYSTYDRVSLENRQYLKSVRDRADDYGSRERQIEELQGRVENENES